MRKLVTDLDARAARAGDATAVVDTHGAHTLSSLLRRGNDLAEVLDDACGPAPTLLVQADNTWRTAVAAIAAGRTGAVLAVISDHSTTTEFDAACKDIRPDAVLVSPKRGAAWMPGGSVREIGALDGWSARLRPVETGVERWGGGAVIGLTSGSTGRPKGVVQSEGALRYAGQATIEAIGLRTGDALAGMVPMSSTAALCFGLYLPLLLGGPAVLLDRWDPAAALRLLTDHDVRWTMCVPTMALQLAAATGDLPASTTLCAMTVGGGPMDAGALGRAEERLNTRILRVFGMSECLGHTTPRPDDDATVRLGRDGRPFPGTEVRVIGPDGTPLPPGELGAAQVRGPSLFLGYARDGQVTAPNLTRDGFLPTGDIAELGTDGTVSIRGREKDVIIRGGRNIDVNEVETAIATHPSVEQVCVVPVPDDLLGERVAVLVVTDRQTLVLETVTAHLSERGLSKAKWPEYLFTVAALPQNRVGKLARIEAARLATDLRDAASVS